MRVYRGPNGRWPNHDPTPKQIRHECEKIQRTWSADERARRNQRPPTTVILHPVPWSDVADDRTRDVSDGECFAEYVVLQEIWSESGVPLPKITFAFDAVGNLMSA